MAILDSWLGMSLSTATVVIGWIMLVFCCLEGVFLILLLQDTEDFAEKLVGPADPNREIVVYNLKMFLYAVLSVYLVFDLLDLIACAVMIIGAQMNNKYMLVPWLLSNAVGIVFKLLSSCCACCVWTLTPDQGGTRMVVVSLNLPLTVIHIWMWFVVYSLFIDMCEP